MQRPVLWTALTAATVFSFMLVLNHFMPLHRDDYDYLMVWKTGYRSPLFPMSFPLHGITISCTADG